MFSGKNEETVQSFFINGSIYGHFLDMLIAIILLQQVSIFVNAMWNAKFPLFSTIRWLIIKCFHVLNWKIEKHDNNFKKNNKRNTNPKKQII